MPTLCGEERAALVQRLQTDGAVADWPFEAVAHLRIVPMGARGGLIQCLPHGATLPHLRGERGKAAYVPVVSYQYARYSKAPLC